MASGAVILLVLVLLFVALFIVLVVVCIAIAKSKKHEDELAELKRIVEMTSNHRDEGTQEDEIAVSEPQATNPLFKHRPQAAQLSAEHSGAVVHLDVVPQAEGYEAAAPAGAPPAVAAAPEPKNARDEIDEMRERRESRAKAREERRESRAAKEAIRRSQAKASGA